VYLYSRARTGGLRGGVAGSAVFDRTIRSGRPPAGLQRQGGRHCAALQGAGGPQGQAPGRGTVNLGVRAGCDDATDDVTF
jgi:hypothetical protein